MWKPRRRQAVLLTPGHASLEEMPTYQEYLSGSQHDNNKRHEHSGVKSENLSSRNILLCDMLPSDL